MKHKRKAFDFTSFRKRLDKIGWPHKEFAELCGIQATHLSRILSGKVRSPWWATRLWEELEALEKGKR